MVIIEENEVLGSGWPLGLGNMNIWLSVREQSATITQTYSLYVPSPSFSSLSSSNLDTESTASFFPDRSVSLGRLIGIRPKNRDSSLRFSARKVTQAKEEKSQRRGEMSQGVLCVPLLQNVMGRMNRSKSNTKLRNFQNQARFI